jgi:hypothetical protein
VVGNLGKLLKQAIRFLTGLILLCPGRCNHRTYIVLTLHSVQASGWLSVENDWLDDGWLYTCKKEAEVKMVKAGSAGRAGFETCLVQTQGI